LGEATCRPSPRLSTSTCSHHLGPPAARPLDKPGGLDVPGSNPGAPTDMNRSYARGTAATQGFGLGTVSVTVSTLVTTSVTTWVTV
jgi:hypothetical protein